jgi:membrane protein CcdC involved in cytochrome C biogenesis
MNWNKWIRQSHRWLSILFIAIVIIVTIVAIGQEQPAEWVYYLPLPPLFLLMFTGLYLFVLPYVARGRSGQRTD